MIMCGANKLRTLKLLLSLRSEPPKRPQVFNLDEKFVFFFKSYQASAKATQSRQLIKYL
jgi:hypothetical protein